MPPVRNIRTALARLALCVTARANSISILGAISSKGLIKVCLRKPLPPSEKRKLAGGAKAQTKDTVTNHYLKFIDDVLEEMDKYPEMKGHYLLMEMLPFISLS
ncbi:hypothetical protein BDF20DRAFT_855702 [Mycotypha africana]|uniref:uncharacterized protein n=1 Tax=Mycotypha africana TaxID=64632 RepID=UPI00230119FD|nr:uncharacterized protein BDF20DRAFT_855702 [Mycotypha africana]KAI8988442.1 hypothetical protein BDF20DRAFT_855702 [Mycotypha africana]